MLVSRLYTQKALCATIQVPDLLEKLAEILLYNFHREHILLKIEDKKSYCKKLGLKTYQLDFRPLCMKWLFKLFFTANAFVVGRQKNCLYETVLLRACSIYWYTGIRNLMAYFDGFITMAYFELWISIVSTQTGG